MAKQTAKITGEEVLDALATADPREIVRLVTSAFEAVEREDAEIAEREKREEAEAQRAATIRGIARSKSVFAEAERDALKKKQREEREAVDGTATRKLSARLKDIAVNHSDRHAPPDADPTIMED